MDTKLAEFAQKLGARIVQLRKEHNFAQERLATLARMNKGYLSSVESGQRIPSIGMLAKLAKVLQVQVFDLFIFPDTGPAGKIWEEIRRGTSHAAHQLRAQFGLDGNGTTTKAARGTTTKPRAKAQPVKPAAKPAVKPAARPAASARTRTATSHKGARTAKAAATKGRRKPR